ncbi:MAG: cadmium-translocating P-type ATPase [Planctomycetes bacterium]|nr:cadmium-translocating P-type ATPase [Planctomycetota bacterium]
MTCAGCAAAVQRAIEAEPGVESAAVSVTEALATVTGTDLAADRIIRAIEGRGFGAEPVVARSAPAERRSEIEMRQARAERAWRFRAITGLGLWVPMAVVHWTIGAGQAWAPWFMLAGASVVLAVAGGGFYRSAWRAARRGTTNMDTLIAIGATTAYVFSLVVFIAQLTGRDLGQPLYFGEAAALLGIISLGHWLEARASAKAGSAVRDLLELQPDEAARLDDTGAIEAIASADVQPGDRILIRPGDRVPVDGIVVDGESEIDEAVVTGEPLPVPKFPGEPVVSGSLNTTGRLVVRATVDGRSTMVARIAEIVAEAQASKASVQRLADRVCAVFVPAVLTIAGLTIVGWLIAGDLGRGVIACVTVLIISCPCALGLATPMAVMVGTGSASRRGILIRSASALERAGDALRVVFDKTGTLTSGRPAVASIAMIDHETSEDTLLRLAASVEAVSEHPIARAIVDAAQQRGIELAAATGFRAVPGRGVHGTVLGRRVEVVADERATCRVIADGAPLGTITVADHPRPDAAQAVRELRAMDVAPSMLSGDRPQAAAEIGALLGFDPDEIHGGADPEAKESHVAGLGPGTVMVGDGINDAAALARADLGIAMASGTNIAIESADIVIPGDRVTAVVETVALARATLRTIRQNLFFAFLYNGLAIPAAALGLLGVQGPIIAAAAMGLSDITVIGNALRLKRRLASPKGPEGGGAKGRTTVLLTGPFRNGPGSPPAGVRRRWRRSAH